MAMKFTCKPDNKKRVKFKTDSKEMLRRWEMTLSAMKKNELDCLVMWGADRVFGGAQKYLSDLHVGVYPHATLFSKEGISIIGHGKPGGAAYENFINDSNIVNNIAVPFLPSIAYTNKYPAQEICKIVMSHRWIRIGFIAMSIIPTSLYKYMTESLKDVEFIDASEILDEIKAIKSPYELELCYKTVQLHEKLLSVVPSILKVGLTEREVALKIRQLADSMYCTDFVVLIGAHPTAPEGNLYLYQNNVINKGDYVYVLIELAGPTGFWAEIGRMYCMGEPSAKMLKVWEDAVTLENDLAKMCKPGVIAKDIYIEGNHRLIKGGYMPETKFYAHGQGYDIVDRPVFCREEFMELKENIYFSMHPRCMNDKGAAICIDNYVVTAEGGKRMSTFPQEIIGINY